MQKDHTWREWSLKEEILKKYNLSVQISKEML